MSKNTIQTNTFPKKDTLDSNPVGVTSIPDEIMGERLFRECDLLHMEEDAHFLIDNIGNNFMQW